MTIKDEIINTLCRDIALHEKLRDIIIEECLCIEEDAVDRIADKTAQKMKIEQEIEFANQSVITLFESYYRDYANIHSESDGEIKMLVEKLHKSIHDSITVIGETVEAIKNSRKKIVTQLIDLNNNKNAINAYVESRI